MCGRHGLISRQNSHPEWNDNWGKRRLFRKFSQKNRYHYVGGRSSADLKASHTYSKIKRLPEIVEKQVLCNLPNAAENGRCWPRITISTGKIYSNRSRIVCGPTAKLNIHSIIKRLPEIVEKPILCNLPNARNYDVGNVTLLRKGFSAIKTHISAACLRFQSIWLCLPVAKVYQMPFK